MKQLTRSFFVATLFLFFTANCFSQNAQFNKGQIILQPGIGFISTLNNSSDAGIGITYPFTLPPLSVAVDVGVTDAISVGGYVATAKSNVYYQDLYGKQKIGTLSHFIVGVRGLYHFSVLEKLDTYGGAMLGYNIVSATGFDNSTGKESDLTYTVLLGARYPFTKYVGVFAEVGYGVAAINLGLSLKLK